MSPTKNPQILRIDPLEPEKSLIKLAAASLKSGKLVIFPTETVYGVGADPALPGAEELLFQAKQRDRKKPIPLLIDSPERVVQQGASFDGMAAVLADRYWPGPLTLVLRVEQGFEGFRIPDHAVALALLGAGSGVLRVTSANQSGCPAACTASEARSALGRSVDIILDSGRTIAEEASTVVMIDAEELKILRRGAIAEDEIRACVENKPDL